LLAASSAELAEVTARLTEWQAKLKEVVERLDTLERNFDAAVAKKAQLAQQKRIVLLNSIVLVVFGWSWRREGAVAGNCQTVLEG
jgi:hypothetical protein